ncbi:hypothetical protein HII36_02710 [Nonomuraea sp. NN258]|uniref:hypothetical protein n=1 Tax=Nonomuraea antri TaxID=2730852 RepID=UPI001569E475|nr:hypothetical protein [Nonomuraea antri]NRQ30750.1 hypothetical protein [Nonomuraea antri]
MALHNAPAAAAPANLVVNYNCKPAPGTTRSIVKYGDVKLETRLTFATDLYKGEPLNFTWKLDQIGVNRFLSPGYYEAGGTVHVVGKVELASSWFGTVKPQGEATQAQALRPESVLSLPETLSDPAHMHETGTISVTPSDIEVDFLPPDGAALVNDGNDNDNPSDLQIQYGGAWTSLDDRPSSENHEHNDLHATSQSGASAELKFVGTGVQYIGPKDKDAGPVDIYLDGEKVATVNPSRDESDDPVNSDLDGGFVIWESPVPLKYGEHTIKIVNASAKEAWLDAFRVITDSSRVPTGYHKAICTLISDPVSIEVTVKERTTQPPTSNPPSSTPPPTSGGPTTPGPTTNGPSTPPPTTNHPGPGHPNPHYTWPTGRHVAVAPPATSTTTTTATPTKTGATATKYVKAQVAKTPQGGVDTGEAPESPANAPYGLMAAGSVMLIGSAGSGLLLRRRKAAHAGGVK